MRAAFATSVRLPLSFRPASHHRPSPSHTRPKMSDDPLFAALCIDNPLSKALRAESAASHLEWAKAQSTNVVFAGPLRHNPDDNIHGSLLIIRAPEAQVAEQTLSGDPYCKAGLFETVSTRKWVMGMASEELPDDLFVVWCSDKENVLELRRETRPRHLDWWRGAGRRGIIGPFPCDGGANGTLIVCEGESEAEVSQWAATDPYNQADMFESVYVSAVKNVIDHVSKSKSVA